MYMSNSRNEMNEALLDLYCSSLVLPTLMSERIILEHSMLIAILHANIGSEIGNVFVYIINQSNLILVLLVLTVSSLLS